MAGLGINTRPPTVAAPHLSERMARARLSANVKRQASAIQDAARANTSMATGPTGAAAQAGGLTGVGPQTGSVSSTAASGESFADYLSAQINEVNHLQHEADRAVGAVATGQSHNLHEMMIALERADVSFRALTKVRSKVLDAYREIMNMSL